MKTLDYYNENAEQFAENTFNADMSSVYKEFLDFLEPDAKILDLGCGSGRDSLAFKKLGYDVTAVDGSESICKVAREKTGIEVQCLRFDELSYQNEFDGIWACASLLHVEKDSMRSILNKVATALKEKGILYVSYKYGNSEREDNGKHYSDYTEEDIEQLFKGTGLEAIKYWKSGDQLKREAVWLNVLARKG